MYNRDLEIREAITAGERALDSLRDARKSLDSAGNWGLLDMLGGRGLSGLMKHVKIGDARQSLSREKSDLERFSRELSDVREIQGIDIEIGDFLTFADFFFDGFIADVMVQSKIRKAKDEIDEAIWRVENLLGRLKGYLLWGMTPMLAKRLRQKAAGHDARDETGQNRIRELRQCNAGPRS